MAVSFKTLLTNYLEHARNEVREASFITEKIRIQQHILPFFGHFDDITKIDASKAQEWKKEMYNKGLSYNYLNAVMSTGIKIFNFASSEKGGKLIEFNPLKEVGTFKSSNIDFHNDEYGLVHQKIKYWTESQFNIAIYEADILFDKLFFTNQYLMGLREGETLALKEKSIDYKNKLIKVRRSITFLVDKQKDIDCWKETKTKNPQSVRDVAAPDCLLELFDRQRFRRKKEDPTYTLESYIFNFNNQNRPIAKSTMLYRFNMMQKRANKKLIEQGLEPLPRITIHDLRHSHASWIINRSNYSDLEKIIMIAQRLGHKDVKETLNTYGHLFPNKDYGLANQLNDCAKNILSTNIIL